MQIQKIIEHLGYSAREAKVYLTLLSLGECHATQIAQKLNMPRTSVLSILEKLHKDQLVDFYNMNRYKYWVAEDPERLLHNLRQKENLVEGALQKLALIKKNTRDKYSRKKPHSFGLVRILADSVSLPVLITNGEAEIEYVNEPWEKLFGYMLEEVKGQNPKIFQSGKTEALVYKKMWQALNQEKMFQSEEVVDIARSGRILYLKMNIFTLRHEGNLFFVQILEEKAFAKSANQKFQVLDSFKKR